MRPRGFTMSKKPRDAIRRILASSCKLLFIVWQSSVNWPHEELEDVCLCMCVSVICLTSHTYGSFLSSQTLCMK